MRKLFALVVVIGLFSVGCTAENTDADRPSDTRPSTEVPNDLAFAAEEEIGLPDPLRLALVRPARFDPSEIELTDQSAVVVADLLYDGLTEMAADGELRPAIASSWQASDDFRNWRFELDPSRGLDAAAVADSFDELRFGNRSGAVAAIVDGIAAVSADGTDSITIELDEPDAGLPWLLAGLPFSIVGPDEAETGRYEIASDDANGAVLRLRTLAVDVADDGADSPRILVTWAADTTATYDLLTLGMVDAAVADPESVLDAGLRFGAAFPETSVGRFFVLNRNSTVLAEPDARAAVLAAVDREAIIENGFSAAVVESDGLLSPSAAGFRADVGCGTLCGYDPDAATASLAAVDLGPEADGTEPDSTPVTLTVGHLGEGQAGAAETLADQLTAVGFDVEVAEFDADGLAAAIVGGRVDVFAFGWVAPGPSIDAVVPWLFAVDSPVNVARIGSSAIDDLINEALSTGDDDARWELYGRAHRTALQEGLIVPVAVSTSTLARAPQAAGLPVRVDGSIDLVAAGDDG